MKLRLELILFNNHDYDTVMNAAKVIDENVNLNDKVFIVDQVEQDGAVYYINYFSNKISNNRFNYEIIPTKEYLEGYNYVYTYSLKDTSILEEHTLYKVDDNFNLIKVK
jgi:hypothetical protein